MDRECGKVLKVIHILVNGNLIKLTVMEYIHGLMVIDMKESLNSVLNMGKAWKGLIMAIFIKVCIQQVNQMDLDNITGQMAAILKVHSKMVYVMVRVYGKNHLVNILINIKDNILMIKNMDMVYLHGQVVIYIKDNIRMM